jgi:hypothetical protein
MKLRLITLAALFFATSMAFAGDLFRVKNLEMSAVAESSNMAKNEVLKNAKRTAFMRVINRIALLTDDDLFTEDNFSDAELEKTIKFYNFSGEKITKTSYKANFDITFKKDSILDILRKNEVSFVTNQSTPVMLVPIYTDDSGTVILQNNPMMQELISFDLANNTAPIYLPNPSQDDVISLSNINKNNYATFASILSGLSIKDIYVLWVKHKDNASTYSLRKIGEDWLFSKSVDDLSLDEKNYTPNYEEIFTNVLNEINVYDKVSAAEKTTSGEQYATLLVPIY